MSTRTLPGISPGLLRLCSPVLLDGESRAVAHVELASDGTPYVRLWGEHRLRHGSEVELDLSDGTGRWHAALWIVAETARLASHTALSAAEVELVERIAWGEDCSAEDIEEIRAMALRLVPE